MKTKQFYDKENDIYCMNWGKVKHSRELFNGMIVLDFDKKDEIVGFEIFDFLKEMDKTQKKIDKIFKLADKKRKKKK